MTAPVPSPASGWSEHPRKAQHHFILSLHLPELGGCQPEQPLQLFPRDTDWNGSNAKELPVPACKHKSRKAGRDESGLGGSHSNTGASLQRHLPSFGMIRMGKPHWSGFTGPLHIPFLPNVSRPDWEDVKLRLLPVQRHISIQGCPLVIALLWPRPGAPFQEREAGGISTLHPAGQTGQVSPVSQVKYRKWAASSA